MCLYVAINIKHLKGTFVFLDFIVIITDVELILQDLPSWEVPREGDPGGIKDTAKNEVLEN